MAAAGTRRSTTSATSCASTGQGSQLTRKGNRQCRHKNAIYDATFAIGTFPRAVRSTGTMMRSTHRPGAAPIAASSSGRMNTIGVEQDVGYYSQYALREL